MFNLNQALAESPDAPPPFPKSHPTSSNLIRLDKAVECQICYSIFVGPVSLGCGHSFCSRCISDALSYASSSSKTCPTCNEPVKETQIRRNRVVEEICDAWKGARPDILSLLTAPPTTSTNLKRKPESSTANPPILKRARQSDGGGGESGSTSKGKARSKSLSPTKRPSMNGGSSRKASGSGSGPIVIDLEDGSDSSDADERGRDRKKSKFSHLNGKSDYSSAGPSRSASSGGGMDVDSEHGIEDEEEEDVGDDEGFEVLDGDGSSMSLPEGIVLCPVCSNQVPSTQINRHLDMNCKDSFSNSNSSSNGHGHSSSSGTLNAFSFTKKGKMDSKKGWDMLLGGGKVAAADELSKMKRIPKPNFNLAKEKELRKMLDEYGLPTGGDKAVLMDRVGLWISIFNSNLDLAKPKAIQSLRSELKRQESRMLEDKRLAREAKDKYENLGVNRDNEDEESAFRRLTQDIINRKNAEKLKKAREQETKAEGSLREPALASVLAQVQKVGGGEDGEDGNEGEVEADVEVEVEMKVD